MMNPANIVLTLLRAFRKCVKRFPAPFTFATALALFLVFIIVAEPYNKDCLVFSFFYFLSVGLVLSLTLALWSEEVKEDNKTNSIQIGAYAILLADTIYLYSTEFGESQATETFLMHASILLALTLALFLISFRKERNDIASWNFTLRLLLSFAVCELIGFVLWGGLSLLLASMNWLFSVDLGEKCYIVTGVLVAFYLPSLLFLGRIPEGEEKHDRTPLRSAFLGNIMRYIFVPLEGLYALVLYAYAIRIIAQWELPNGYVSWLVIASMAGCIGIEIGLYPIRHSEGRPFDEKVARYLPLVLMPLLLLMTVGIIRRFNDYGITISRLYLITLNLWFYVVCLGLYFTRARRIHWVSISFATLFLLTSALPINFSNFTRRHLLDEVRDMINKAGGTMPLNVKAYESLMNAIPQEQAKTISSKLQYVESAFSRESIESIVNQKGGIVPFSFYIYRDNTNKHVQDIRNIWGSVKGMPIDIPQGYTKMQDKHLDIEIKDGQKLLEVPVENDGEIIDTLVVYISDLKAYTEEMTHPVTLRSKHGNCTFVMTSFNYYRLEGYLFTK